MGRTICTRRLQKSKELDASLALFLLGNDTGNSFGRLMKADKGL
jgi:hypothetical protein